MKNKKLLSILGIGCSLLLLVGCSNSESNKGNDNKDNENVNDGSSVVKKLNCSMDFSDSMNGLGTMKMEVLVEYNEDGSVPQEATMIEEIEITSEEITDNDISLLATKLEDQTCTEEFKSCAATIDGNKITLKAVGDMNSLTGEDSDSESKTYDATKEHFESMGYTCK